MIKLKFFIFPFSTPVSTTHICAKSWPIEYLKTELTVCWQRDDQPLLLARGSARKPRSPLILCQFSHILIVWTRSAILGHFVKAVKFIGIQLAGRQHGDGAYFVVLIESRSPSLQTALNRREASGESITITCPLVILFHSTSPNLTAWHELFTTLSVLYTRPLWLGALSTVWSLESWKNNFELNGFTLAPLLPGFLLFKSICFDIRPAICKCI